MSFGNLEIAKYKKLSIPLFSNHKKNHLIAEFSFQKTAWLSFCHNSKKC